MPNHSAYIVIGDRHYSYQTVIRQTIPGGLTLGNVTWYSHTTVMHQRKAGSKECDVLLDNVPRGTIDLLPLALERGLVVVDLWRTDQMPASAFHYRTPDAPPFPHTTP